MRQRPDTVMIFAAGFGTRMGALTRDRPKPLVELGGRPLIDRALALADTAGVPRRVVNTHYRAGQLTAHLAGRPGVMLSHEPEILETGGGLRAALPHLGGAPVFTLNPDAVFTGANPLVQLADAWRPGRMDALMLLVPAERARGVNTPGDFAMVADGKVQRGTGYVYTGAQILHTDGLAGIDESAFSLNRLWDRMLTRARVFGIVHRGGWCDAGTPQALRRAEAMLAGAGHV